MELRHLEALVAVAETTTFTAAAQRMHLAQQSLSRLVAQLEREVGARVFARTTRSVALTPAGEAMLEPARRALAAVAEAAAAARGSGAGERELRVDVSSTGLETGAAIVRALRRAHPDVAVQEVEVGIAAGADRLRRGELDLVVGLSEGHMDLSEEIVRREPVLLGVARDHRLAAWDAVPVAELATEEILLPASDAAGEWVRFVHLLCRQAGVTPRPWRGVTHGSVAAAEVVAGGTCVVPTSAWSRVPEEIVFRPLVDPVPVLAWSLLTHPEAHHLAPFTATVRALAREQGWLEPR